MNTYNNEDRTLDLRRLCIDYLKRWRVILLVMGVCALLLGVYGAVRAPGPVALTADEKAAIRQQLDAANAELDACTGTLESSQSQLLSASDIVLARQEDIADAEDRLADQQGYLATYEDMLREADRIRSSVPAADRAELMAQITALTEKIPVMQDTVAASEAQVTAMKQELAALEESFETTLPQTIEDTEDRIAELEQLCSELSASLEPAPGKVTVGGVLKMAVIGAVLGAFAVACCVLWKSLTGKRIDSADLIRERYRIPVLADLHVSDSKHSSPIDLALEKWGGEVRQLDEKTACPLLAAKLQSIFPEEKGEIFLFGTVGQDALEQLCSRMDRYLSGSITLRAAGNPATDAEAALAAKNCCAVLVEETDRSLYPEADRVLEQLTLSNAKVLGCILI